MHLHRIQNPLPALEAVEVGSLSSFPAFSLGAPGWVNHQLREAAGACRSATALRRSHSREIRGLPLPFAAPLPPHTHPAIA